MRSNQQEHRVATLIHDLSHQFRLIVADASSDDFGTGFWGSYREEVINGVHRVLEDWRGCDNDNNPYPMVSIYRVKDGVRYDPPLVEAYPYPDDLDSMLIYQCGDDLSAIPKNSHPRDEIPDTPILILPEEKPSVDWTKEGF